MYELNQSEIDAAREQGVQSICLALEDHRIWTAIQNLGGHLMGGIATAEAGTVVITGDGPEAFVVGAYPGDTWEDGDLAKVYAEAPSQERAIEIVQEFLDAMGGQA